MLFLDVQSHIAHKDQTLNVYQAPNRRVGHDVVRRHVGGIGAIEMADIPHRGLGSRRQERIVLEVA